MVALKIIFTLFSEFMALQCFTCYGVMQAGQQDACFDGVEETNTTDCNDGEFCYFERNRNILGTNEAVTIWRGCSLVHTPVTYCSFKKGYANGRFYEAEICTATCNENLCSPNLISFAAWNSARTSLSDGSTSETNSGSLSNLIGSLTNS